MTPVLDQARRLCASLDKAQTHPSAVVAAFKLVALVPKLVEYALSLEEANTHLVRHVVCKCEWCGDEFNVPLSCLKSKRYSGRFCSCKCAAESRSSDCQDRKKREEVRAMAALDNPDSD